MNYILNKDDKTDWILVVSVGLFIIINLICWRISIKYSYELKKYKHDCNVYVEQNLSEDELNNLIIELETAPKVLMECIK